MGYCGWINSRGQHRFSLAVGVTVGLGAKLGGSGSTGNTGVTVIRGWKGDLAQAGLSAIGIQNGRSLAKFRAIVK